MNLAIVYIKARQTRAMEVSSNPSRTDKVFSANFCQSEFSTNFIFSENGSALRRWDPQRLSLLFGSDSFVQQHSNSNREYSDTICYNEFYVCVADAYNNNPFAAILHNVGIRFERSVECFCYFNGQYTANVNLYFVNFRSFCHLENNESDAISR